MRLLLGEVLQGGHFYPLGYNIIRFILFLGKYYVCEMLNLANLIGQWYFTDRFLRGQFSKIAWGGIRSEEHVSVLPILASCDMWTYFGSGGDLSNSFAMCVFPLNMINQKFYTFWYFWMAFLFTISVSMLVTRIALILFTDVRVLLLNFYLSNAGNLNIVSIF